MAPRTGTVSHAIAGLQQLNPASKRKHLGQVTGNNMHSKRQRLEAAFPKATIPSHRFSILEDQVPDVKDDDDDADEQNYDHLWHIIRERKAQRYLSEAAMERLDQEKAEETGSTTTAKARKDQQLFAEEMLHPRWIAIKRNKPSSDPQHRLRQLVHEFLSRNDTPFEGLESLVGRLHVNIDEIEQRRIRSRLEYLNASHASEAQWESDLWRHWFLKGSVQTPDSDPIESKPFMGRVVQAKMSLSIRRGAVLPPLLASADDRRASGLHVAKIPWDPDLRKNKGNQERWYPDYLYAVSQSSLATRGNDYYAHEVENTLPAFRIAQHSYLPASWLAEIKSADTELNHLAAENYLAFMSAYLLHERLILRWLTKNNCKGSINAVEIDDSLAIHCISCCGPICKIWRMSIRPRPDPSSSPLKPVRYDMQRLDTLDIRNNRGVSRLGDWINILNAFGLTAQLGGIAADLEAIDANPPVSDEYSWASEKGFVYNPVSEGNSEGIHILAVPLKELRNAYTKGTIKADEYIGNKVVQEWNSEGVPLEVDITLPKHLPTPPSSHEPSASTSEQAVEANAIQRASLSIHANASTWTAHITDTEFTKFSRKGLVVMASAFSSRITGPSQSAPASNASKEALVTYLVSVQTQLGTGLDAAVVWKRMGLQRGDVKKLRVETLRIACVDLGGESIGKTKPELADMVEELLELE
ncbi:uncharacterized protein BDZ99DRAFT_478950 [Mytilinidion resinicola]|uniref:Uncharacterized protein n=1 Tax=Mytilinidion resinicola TaxID=574789 RepID=A0A6A6YFY1_9PEZI|nr:uncharacterized protein BDZ99DRAFT_478950 [Mytilinidion resinicola]KAF2807478.1 hypothetical protein BDZ99DRAFT_478950 [Mytilinidion resinicola]